MTRLDDQNPTDSAAVVPRHLQPKRSTKRREKKHPLTSLVLVLRMMIALGLWVVTLYLFVSALAALSTIFTGDPSFGACDGFQFTTAWYTAVVRFVATVIVGYLVWRVLRWRPFQDSDTEPEAGQ